jgi:hypothetical protein
MYELMVQSLYSLAEEKFNFITDRNFHVLSYEISSVLVYNFTDMLM